jgi:exo-beta-1,3-glucanase (GH17 family)
MTDDLYVLKQAGFNGIITFGAEQTLWLIPELAKSIGFKGVIMGIWKPDSPEELKNAIRAKNHVDAFCVGHMGLNINYDYRTLKNAITQIKERTNKPVSTTESIDLYNQKSRLIQLGDWIFPDARIYWQQMKTEQVEVLLNLLVQKYEQLIGLSEKPVLIKTVGFPTKGSYVATEQNQSHFFDLLLANAKHPFERLRFAYFEAFDQPWKTWHNVEGNWGIFKNDRSPKPGEQKIWGKRYMYNTDLDSPQTRSGSLIYLIVSLILANSMVVGLAIHQFMLGPNQRRVKIELLQNDKRITKNQAGKIVTLSFDRTPNECFKILLLFCENKGRQLYCGEIIKKTEGAKQNECKFDIQQQNRCIEKKGFCNPYKTLSTHRIRSINKLLENHQIGQIRNISGQSKWVLILNDDISIKIVA